jgi:hypothetical protein
MRVRGSHQTISKTVYVIVVANIVSGSIPVTSAKYRK